jgi:hypothetical protein
MKLQKTIKLTLFVLHLLCMHIRVLPAQSTISLVSAEERYQLLLEQINIYKDYRAFGRAEKNLIDQAGEFALNDEFELALIYLEETLDLLKMNTAQTKEGAFIENRTKINTNIKFSLLSGIDFNRQEFEVGYLQNDSTVLEEINKPYLGIAAVYHFPYATNKFFEIRNTFRYDQENLRDDYRIGWKPGKYFLFEYRGFWNRAKQIESNSFWEHDLNGKFRKKITQSFDLLIENKYDYKIYKEQSDFLFDFYRNRFLTNLDWKGTLSAEYVNEMNESIGRDDTDYLQHTMRFGFRSTRMQTINYNLIVRGSHRDYFLEFENNIIDNIYKQFGFDTNVDFSFFRRLRLEVENNFILKSYKQKSSLEPDYIWNFFRPSLLTNPIQDIEISLGYEWEVKTYDSDVSDTYEVGEQDYNSKGIFTSLSYFTLRGIYISGSLSYQWRRYPKSITNDLISLYSDRNVLSLLLIAYLPVSNHFALNVFAAYDNDEDIDKDQQNNQSTIFTAELEYKF